MRTILEDKVSLYEIQKSKFYGIIVSINSIEDFNNKLDYYKKQYKKATHYCYAYILDNKTKTNDDGEPSGTAGVPLLTVLKNNDLNNVGIISIRYFGGIKLGAGGLLRAYSKSAQQVIDESSITTLELKSTYTIISPLSCSNLVLEYLNKHHTIILNKEYNDNLTIKCCLNEDDSSLIKNISNEIEILENDKEYIKI